MGQDEGIGVGMMWGKGWGNGGGGGLLGYLNFQSLTHFVLHEARRSVNCFYPLFKGYLHRTYILRWKNDKREKEQR